MNAQNTSEQIYKYGQRVATSMGEGEIVANAPEHNSWLICFSRKEFAPDAWKALCPANGPCAFRLVRADDVRPVEGK